MTRRSIDPYRDFSGKDRHVMTDRSGHIFCCVHQAASSDMESPRGLKGAQDVEREVKRTRLGHMVASDS